jgi:signal transduction histidine kinase
MQSIEREAAFMIHLARDVLDYSRAELVVLPESIEAGRLAATIRDDLAEVFRDAQVQYSVEQREDGLIRVDVERFRRVVLNLARNALAALGDGGRENGAGGRFQVLIERSERGWRFSFLDNGPGLSPEQAARFFEPFASGGRGAGLGLAVVERIVAAHGGAVRVRSGPGGGACFEAELPNV